MKRRRIKFIGCELQHNQIAKDKVLDLVKKMLESAVRRCELFTELLKETVANLI